MAISKEQRLANIHAEAIKEFDDIQAAVRPERMQCLEDRRFYSLAGAQWQGPLGEQFANKPKFEVNKVHLAVIRIINEYRNNRVTVDFVSKDGTPNTKLADTCDDLYRADEVDSGAQEAYDNAFEEAVGGGFGAWRLRTAYEDEEDDEDERQRIKIEPIFDADSSVFFDLNAKRKDKADAKRCYVLTSMTPESYIEEYGDDPATWDKSITMAEFDWATPDVVYIAELYRVEEVKETIRIFRKLDGDEERYTDDDFEDDPELANMLAAIGTVEVRQKKVKRSRVHKYIMSGSKILEDCGYIAGKCIPIVPVYGKRWFVDNIERCMGHVRLAKDAQRLKNMQLSKLGEISAISSVEKPIFTPEQMSGHQVMWEQDNLKNYPYLLVNPMTDANGQPMVSGPIGFTKPPAIPPAMAALLQITEQDMQEILGANQQAEKMVSNISGVAVDMIQQRLDMQTFIYMSNFGDAMRRCGEIWLGMGSEVYTGEKRTMKGVSEQGQIRPIELMRPMVNEVGTPIVENDLSDAKFDVISTVGPSSTSRRSSTVRDLMGMLAVTQDPETQQVIQSMIMMNMEGNGISDVNDYFRAKLVKMGAVKPTEEEQQQMAEAQQNARPDPNALYLQAAAEEATAKAAAARADTVYTIANAENKRANTAKTISEIDVNEQKQALEVIDRFAPTAPPQPDVSVAVVNP